MIESSNMTPNEREIWNAAYGAAFASFYIKRSEHCGNDEAEKHTNAEEAGFIADFAVRRLREWQIKEDPDMGLELMELSKP